jgi:hypothetical protein
MLRGGLISQAAVRPFFIVVKTPSIDLIRSIFQAQKPVLVQALLPKTAVERFDEGTLSHGAVQGYNSQALIDGKHQVIVPGEAFGNGQDHGHIPPMLEGALANLQSIGYAAECLTGKIFTADSNYHTLVNLRKCRELKLDVYIPDRKFRNRDPRFDT